MAFLGLTDKQIKQLEFEVVPKRARLQLTRMLRSAVDSREANAFVARINNVVNICRNVLGLPINLIEVNDWGDYEYVDVGWMRSELEVSMRRPDTAELVETLADLIQEGWLDDDEVNELLASHGCEFSFDKRHSDEVRVRVTPVEEIEEEQHEDIPNIRVLVQRMESSLGQGDYAGVLHSSASIFETLAKDVLALPSVEDKTLASFFDRYKKESQLPEPVLNFILETYKRRNTEPLAGHGQLKEPTVTKEQAVVLSEMTKAFVRIERQLSSVQVGKVTPHTKVAAPSMLPTPTPPPKTTTPKKVPSKKTASKATPSKKMPPRK